MNSGGRLVFLAHQSSEDRFTRAVYWDGLAPLCFSVQAEDWLGQLRTTHGVCLWPGRTPTRFCSEAGPKGKFVPLAMPPTGVRPQAAGEAMGRGDG